MKRLIILITVIISCFTLSGQVTFILASIPDYTPVDDTIYLAGDLNGWDPGNPDSELEKNVNENWFIILPAEPAGTVIDFKFTRGDWSTVEKGANGEEIPNRQFTYGNGDTVNVDILNWADNGGGGNTTAAENVSIMDESFYMPELDRNRRIWIYLPPDYDIESNSYPVLYMHDGQNVFDMFTSYAGEWEVDETLNYLAEEGYQVPIVVGIDNGGTERMNEYNPWVNPQYGGGQGDEYIDFIVTTLKPYVDENYRTLPNRENTGIMGSSMGGFISHYGALKYQDVFSKAGIFSPSYWVSDSVWALTTETGRQQSMKLYQLIGGLEGAGVVTNMWAIHDVLTDMGFGENELFSKEVANGQHNEAFWRDQFEEAYLWMYASYANDINERYDNVEILITPNPVTDYININSYKSSKQDSLEILDMKGIKVMSLNIGNKDKVDVKSLVPGSYVLIIRTNKTTYRGKFIKQ